MKNFGIVFTLIVACFLVISMTTEASFMVEHSLGTVNITETPQTIVVFDYGVLDALDVLEVTIAGLPASNLPAFLSKFNSAEYVNVGTLFEPDFEKIYALKPDLIIISSRQAEQYDELSRIAPTLYMEIDNANWWGSVQSNLRLLGQIFGKEAEVEDVLGRFQQRIDGIRERAEASGTKALILMANDGALSVYGAESRFGIIHQDLGFAPADQAIDDATHGQNVSFEYLVRINPEAIFVIDRAAVAGGSIGAQQVMSNPIVQMTKASQGGKIIYLHPHAWYVVSGGIRSTEIMLDDIDTFFQESRDTK